MTRMTSNQKPTEPTRAMTVRMAKQKQALARANARKAIDKRG